MKLANVLTKKLAKNHEEENATAVENLSFKSYAKKFKGGNWLSRDESVMKKYNEDELCGGSFPYSFYKSLFSNLRNCNKGIGEIPKDKSIFLIAGTKDPVSQGAKQVKQLYKKYKKSGLNVQMKLYKNARHELYGGYFKIFRGLK